MSENEEKEESTLENLPKLETVCRNCKSKGGHWGDGGYGNKWWACGECAGAGYVPTDFGRKVLDIVRHNLTHLLAANHEHHGL